jgi:Uri superfamily endonuclease
LVARRYLEQNKKVHFSIDYFVSQYLLPAKLCP